MNNQSMKVPFREAALLNKRAFQICWKNSPGIIVSTVVSSVVTALFPYVNIYFSARIIEELAGARNISVLKNLVILTITVNAALAVMRAVLERWHNYHQAGLSQHLQKIYSDKLLAMDFDKVDENNTHELLGKVKQVEMWNRIGLWRVYDCVGWVCGDFCGVIGATALSVSLFTSKIPESAGKLTVLNSPLMSLILLLLILLTSGLVSKTEGVISEFWQSTSEAAKQTIRKAAFCGKIVNDKSRAMDIRTYRQERIFNQISRSNTTFRPGGMQSKGMSGKVGIIGALGTGGEELLIGIVYLFVCVKAWTGAFGVGMATQYIGAVTALSTGLSQMLTTIVVLHQNAFFLRDTFAYLDIPNEMYQGTLTVEKRSDRNYVVEFKDVSFKYPDSAAWSLRHVNMKFRVGQRLAIVGQNGSGKTTFIKLLCRLYDPTEGQILLNGIDIRKYNYQEYMSIFSVVFQDFQMFAFPLGENLAVGHKADRSLAEKRLADAGFENWKEKMPKGLDTYLYKEFDESGVDVSGGEAQKIAIARALYKDAPFIILDEPTAALDPIAEAEIYSKFNDIVEDKTAIYISHRLSSCKFCDEIAVFDAGSIVQQGSHERLVSDEHGKYYELWNAQAQYYT